MTWTKSGATIIQTDTDANLSGLNGISGITTTAFNDNFTIYNLGSNRLEIRGTLTHDPDVEMLVYSATGTDATTPVIVITSTGTYNYGVERTGNGNSAYSSGVGLMCVREDTGGSREWRANQKGLIQNNSGTLNLKGGAISSAKPIGLAGFNADSTDGASTLNIKNTKIFRPSGLASSERREIRLDDAANTISGSVENLIVDGFLITHRNLPATFSVTLANAAIGQLAGGPSSSVLRDLDTSGNIRSDYDLGTDDDGTGAKFYTVINASAGSNTRCMPKEGVGGNRQLGGAIIQKEVSFNVKNSSGSAIDGVKVYASDTDNSYRKNANGQDHTADKVYEYTTDANGDTETITVTTAITNIDSEDSSTTPITYSRWDTVYGSYNIRYKVDRRGLDDSGDDIFTFKLIEYGKSISTTNQALKGLGELEVNWVLFDDQLITDPRVTTDAYQVIDTPEKFYNKAKAFLVDYYEGETETIVTRDGNTINIGSYNLDIDANATEVFAFDGFKITIKASTFVGNITTTGGTIDLLNGAEIVGSYGDISVLPFTITNVEAGSTVQLYNVADDNEISNDVVTGAAGTKVTYSGTYANSLADANDEVRLRITCQSGATALLPYESFGVATSAGISFKANQVEDTIYNNNAIDGGSSSFDNSTLEIDADYTNFQLDVSDTDNPGVVTTQQIYAKYAYLVTTSEGIAKFFGAITAENGSNYRINTSVVDLKIQNVSSSDMIISGARLYRDDSATVIVKGPAGAGTLSHDTGEFLQYIQPQITAAMNEYGVAGPDDLNPIKKNTNLIPGLL